METTALDTGKRSTSAISAPVARGHPLEPCGLCKQDPGRSSDCNVCYRQRCLRNAIAEELKCRELENSQRGIRIPIEPLTLAEEAVLTDTTIGIQRTMEGLIEQTPSKPAHLFKVASTTLVDELRAAKDLSVREFKARRKDGEKVKKKLKNRTLEAFETVKGLGSAACNELLAGGSVVYDVVTTKKSGSNFDMPMALHVAVSTGILARHIKYANNATDVISALYSYISVFVNPWDIKQYANMLDSLADGAELQNDFTDPETLSADILNTLIKWVQGVQHIATDVSFINMQKFLIRMFANVDGTEKWPSMYEFLYGYVPKKLGAMEGFSGLLEVLLHTLQGMHKFRAGHGLIGSFLRSEASSLEDQVITETGRADSLIYGNWPTKEFTTLRHYLKHLEDLHRRVSLLRCANQSDEFRRRNLLQQVNVIQAAARDNMNDGAIKEAPFAVVLIGQSNIAKSMVVSQLLTYLLRINNFLCNQDSIVNMTLNEKFHSNYTSMTTGVVLDDIAAFKDTEFASAYIPTIIDMMNNYPKCAVKADLTSKGRILLNPNVVVATTNVPDLGASFFSRYPHAIMRRFHHHIKVTVKPEFAHRDGSIKRELLADGILDVWNFEVYEVMLSETKSGASQAGPSTHFTSFADLCTFLRLRSAEHFRIQRKIVIDGKKIMEAMICETCSNFEQLCSCEEQCPVCERNICICDLEARALRMSTSSEYMPEVNHFCEKCHELLRDCAKRGQCFEDQAGMVETVVLPAPENTLWQVFSARFLLVMEHAQLELTERRLFLLLIAFYMFPSSVTILLVCVVFSLCVLVVYCQRTIASTGSKMVDLVENETRYLETKLQFAVGALVGLGLLIKGVRGYMASRSLSGAAQGFEGRVVKPLSGAEKKLRTNVDTVPWTSAGRTIVFADLCKIARGNMRHIVKRVQETEAGTGKKVVRDYPFRAFCIKDTLYVTNLHSVKDFNGNFFRIRGYPNAPGGKTLIVPREVKRIESKDLLFFECAQLGTGKNLFDYLPTTADALYPHIRRVSGKLLGDPLLAADGGYEKFRLDIKTFDFGPRTVSYPGTVNPLTACLYRADGDCENGDCGRPMVVDATAPMIAGIHTMGDTKNKLYGFIVIAQADVPANYAAFEFSSQGHIFYRFEYTEPHKKSLMHSREDLCLGAHLGETALPRRKYHSAIVPTPFSQLFEEKLTWPVLHKRPDMSRPKIHFERHLLGCGAMLDGLFDEGILRKAADDYWDVVSAAFDNADSTHMICVLDHVSAISGCDGVYGMDALPKNTSRGFPDGGPKKLSLEPYDDGEHADGHIMDQEHMSIAEEMYDNYRRGNRCHIIFEACLKDEPVALGKDKVRVFAAAPLCASFLLRKMFLGVCSFYMRSWERLESTIGINVYDSSWHRLHEHWANGVGKTHRAIFGDYSGYDYKVVYQQFSRWASWIIYKICERAGYSAEDLVVCRGLLTDLCYPVYHYNGSLFEAVGSNPSGHNLTILFNTIVNCLLIRYCYFSKELPAPFNKHVVLFCNGDDNGMTVDEETDFYHCDIARTLEPFGIKYTTHDKRDGEGLQFVSLYEVEYLKRSFRFEDSVGRWLAPLNKNSIMKSVHFTSTHCALRNSALFFELADNAAREFSLHGQQEFNERMVDLVDVSNKMGYHWVASDSYEEMLHKVIGDTDVLTGFELHHSSSSGEEERKKDPPPAVQNGGRVEREYVMSYGIPIKTLTMESASKMMPLFSDESSPSEEEDEQEIEPTWPKIYRDFEWEVLQQHPDDFGWQPYRELPNDLDRDVYVPRTPVADEKRMKQSQSFELQSDGKVPGRCLMVVNEKEILKCDPSPQDTDSCEDRLLLLGQPARGYLHCGELGQHVGTKSRAFDPLPALLNWITETKKNITTFLDSNEEIESIPISRDATFSRGHLSDSEISSFLERPIRIFQTTWTVGSTILTDFDPWNLYFTNPRVIEKLRYYKNLRCDMNIKVMVNGTQFHYGKLGVFYDPLSVLNSHMIVADAPVATEPRLVYLSQKMNVTIDPCCSVGGCMTLPFLFLKNWMDLTDNDHISGMGKIFLQSFTPLRQANNESNDVTVSIFAWPSNLEICVPTTFAAQSEMSPLSNLAFATSRVARRLAQFPFVSSYATATGEVAETLGKAARALGFSRPIVTDPPRFIKPQFSSSLANTDTNETVTKLSLDTQQELTIDPRTLSGVAQDHMSMESILQREAYLTSFTWTTSDPEDDVLWNTRVTPLSLRISADGAGNDVLFPTPMSHIAAAFRMWTGEITYRFVIVASKFNKGRLRFTWDPHHLVSASQFNNVYSRVVDLETEREVEITVPWMQDVAYLTMTSLVQPFSVAKFTSASDQANGTLAVSVLNELTTPNNLVTDVEVLVYVRGGGDLHFINPKDAPLLTMAPQSAVPECVERVDPQDSEPVAPEQEDPHPDKSSLVYAGERVHSLRALLKRYTYFRNNHSDGEAGLVVRHEFLRTWFPTMPGRISGGHDTDLALMGQRYNYVGMTYLAYFSAAYLFRRGAVRWKYLVNCDGPNRYTASVSRLSTTAVSDPTAPHYQKRTVIATSEQDAPRLALTTTSGGGKYVTPVREQPYLEVELPFYSRFRGAFAHVWNTMGTSVDGTNSMNVNVFVDTEGGVAVNLEEYCAAGEDYMLDWYNGAPPMYQVVIT